MTRTLYAITGDLLALNAMLDEAEGDMSKLPAAELGLLNFFECDKLAAQMDELEAERAQKLDSYVNLTRELAMRAAAAKAEAEQWLKRSQSLASRADYLTRRMVDHLVDLDCRELRTASGRVLSVQSNGGVEPIEWSDVVSTEQVKREVPECIRTVEEIDRPRVRELLEAGASLSFAKLKGRGVHLRIRP